MNEGMIEEVSRLHAQGLSWERLDSFGLEYRFIARYLQNAITKEEMMSKLQIAIGQFAKRQMTWFRRMEKKGVPIEWVSANDYPALHRRVLKVLS
jgi:tRNA dimethylallyltransferase